MIHPLAERFSAFAESECFGSSPLYYELSRSLMRDKTLLDIAGQSRPGQPIPNLLFASVHYLLTVSRSHPLQEYYPSLSANPAPLPKLFPSFAISSGKGRRKSSHYCKPVLFKPTRSEDAPTFFRHWLLPSAISNRGRWPWWKSAPARVSISSGINIAIPTATPHLAEIFLRTFWSLLLFEAGRLPSFPHRCLASRIESDST